MRRCRISESAPEQFLQHILLEDLIRRPFRLHRAAPAQTNHPIGDRSRETDVVHDQNAPNASTGRLTDLIRDDDRVTGIERRYRLIGQQVAGPIGRRTVELGKNPGERRELSLPDAEMLEPVVGAIDQSDAREGSLNRIAIGDLHRTPQPDDLRDGQRGGDSRRL